MKNVTDSFVPLDHWSSAGSFGLNTDILATNPINLIVVLGVLIFFGKGVLSDLLDNRKQRILNTIRNSEELRGGAIEQLEKARARLRKVEIEADQYLVNESSDRERKKLALMNSTYQNIEQKENSQNERIRFEQEKTLNQVRQRFFQQALERALETLNNRLTNELHLRIISANIDMLGTIKEITD